MGKSKKKKLVFQNNLRKTIIICVLAAVALVLLLTQNKIASKETAKINSEKSADSQAPREVDCSKIAQKASDGLAAVLDKEAVTEACEFMGCSSFFN